ncbi:hypothetical protein [Winogradskyella haliclonae]|uniref:DUF4138 domain-containing protein n=1 Tax=Winogradskyella haliclonae TaxID=2048558 RepID=A0ABQ2BVZ1_9FLAO|nr:hypothetical protein [Winogradskyella haliclonae]GGI55737.1 hypothetical protein GCM10011444_00460 [Winogradskyella haliclonae]
MKLLFNLLSLFLLTNLAFAQQKLVPKTENTKTVISTGKTNSIYYNLTKHKPVSVTIEGPGELIIYNRTVVTTNKTHSFPFILKYNVDGKQIKTQKIPKKQKSQRSRLKNNTDKAPTKAHKIKIKVPDGKHNYSFYRQTTKQQVLSRFTFVKNTKLTWNELKPKSAKQVILKDVKRKKEVTYFQISKKETFAFKTSKSTSKVRLFFRANFNYKMLEDCVNRLQIKIDGNPTVFKIVSKKSSRLENLTHPKLIPGALEKIYIDIPLNGVHDVEVSLKDENASALIRVFATATNLLNTNSNEKFAFSY